MHSKIYHINAKKTILSKLKTNISKLTKMIVKLYIILDLLNVGI